MFCNTFILKYHYCTQKYFEDPNSCSENFGLDCFHSGDEIILDLNFTELKRATKLAKFSFRRKSTKSNTVVLLAYNSWLWKKNRYDPLIQQSRRDIEIAYKNGLKND